MNKSDLKDWTRDMLESEIVNMNAKNFQLQNEVNNLRESNGRLKAQIESSNNQYKELKNQYNDTKREFERLSDKCQKAKTKEENIKGKISAEEVCLFSIFLLKPLSNISFRLEEHGCYYKNGEKCKKQVHFTEGIGLHDGTGRPVQYK